MRSEVAGGFKWSLVERVSVQVIQLVLGFVLARLLSPGDYGLVGMLAIFIAISENIIDSGFSKALIRKLDRSETDFATAFYFNVAVGLACYASLYASAGLIADFFGAPELKDLTRVMALTMLIGSLSVVQTAKMTIAVDFKSQAKASATAALISGLVGVGLAYSGFGVWALAWQAVTKAAINAAMLWAMARWKPQITFSLKSFRELFGYGSKLLAASIVNTIHGQLTTLVIGKYYTPADLGNYTRGQQFATIPNFQIVGVLQRVTFPLLARLQNDSEALVAAYRKYVRTSSMSIIFLTVALAALAKPIILLLLTEKWSGAIIFLQLYAFAVMFDHINQINMNLLQINGRTGLFLRIEAVKKAISLVLLVVSVPFGVLAVCLSRVAYCQVAVLINTWCTGRIYGLGYREQSRDFMPYLLMSLVACAPAFALSEMCDIWIVDIAAGGAASVALYAVILHLRKDPAYEEFVWPAIKKIVDLIQNKRN